MADKNKLKKAAEAFFDDEEQTTPQAEPVKEEAITTVRDLPASGGVVKLEAGFYRLPTADTKETKSKRVQILMQPSLLAQVQAEAKRRNTSVNELFHIALREFLGVKQ